MNSQFKEVLLNKKRYNQKGPSIFIVQWSNDWLFTSIKNNTLQDDDFFIVSDEDFVVEIESNSWRNDGLVMYKNVVKTNESWHTIYFDDIFETYEECLEYVRKNNIRIKYFQNQYKESKKEYDNALLLLKQYENRLFMCENNLI